MGEEHCLGTSEVLLPTLIELYFDNIYQSDLILHKKSFSESVARGSASAHVLLSVCAWSAKCVDTMVLTIKDTANIDTSASTKMILATFP